MNKKYYIEDGNFYILKEELNRGMRELDEEEFNIWFMNILEDARREANENESRA